MITQLSNDLEDQEKIVLSSLGALNNTPLRSKIKIQKLLFLTSNVFKEYKDLLEFEPHLFGPYSETLEYIVEDLQKLGLIEIDNSRYKLTNEGLKVYKQLKPKKDIMEVIEDFKEFLNNLSDEEILAFIYVSYPDYIKESVKWDQLKLNRVKIAISLLRKEKISFGKAVEISGLSVSEFEEELKKNNVKWKNFFVTDDKKIKKIRNGVFKGD